MRTFWVLALVLLWLGSSALSAGDMKTGVLIDEMCSKGAGTDLEKYKKHKVSCSMMEMCVDSGFGLFADGKYYSFDDEGDTKAVELLKTMDQERSNVRVRVTGNFSGDEAKVSTIEEATD